MPAPAPAPNFSSNKNETEPQVRERITVGRINATWGLKGHVKVTALTSNDTRLIQGAKLIVAGERREIMDVITPQGYPIIRFAGINDRSAAEKLRGKLIQIEADELPELPQGEYYVDDLCGLSVLTTDGVTIGILKEVLTTGANDVYLIKRPNKKDTLIPAIADVISAVDLETGQMTINPLPGMLEN